MKETGAHSSYQMDSRKHWNKLKRSLLDQSTIDSFDLVVMGGYYGKGKRQGLLGSYLLGAYDEPSGKVQAITKIGTGFSETFLAASTEEMIPLAVEEWGAYEMGGCE